MYGTQTQSWTITNARYVTSKIAADLDLVRAHYGTPSAASVANFAEEAAMLLARRYLGTVEYGFKREGLVIFSLRYEARSDGSLSVDDRPGRVPPDLNLAGAEWYSWLTYSDVWWTVDPNERANFEATLPISRST